MKRFGLKKLISGILISCMIVSMIPATGVAAAEQPSEKYPYVVFAGGDGNSLDFGKSGLTVNGNIHTNGTLTTNGNYANINGDCSAVGGIIKGQNSVNIRNSVVNPTKEPTIIIGEKIQDTYFTNNCDKYNTSYSINDVNVNLHKSVFAKESINLSGNISLDGCVGSNTDIILNGGTLNSNNTVIYSENGNVIINNDNATINGLIYAPNGKVAISGQNLQVKGAIIAKEIKIYSGNVNMNWDDSVAKFVGNKSTLSLYAYGDYDKNSNAVNITWTSSVKNGQFEVMSSNDGITYSTVATLTDKDSYNYPITGSPEKLYFKVKQTVLDNTTSESNRFEIIKTKSGYKCQLDDTDGDGLLDVYEKVLGTDPTKEDTDGDGLTDYQEVYITNTNPLKVDTDGNGISDANEDPDKDGLTNLEEIKLGTNPRIADTDNDGLSDGDEVHKYKTDPMKYDTDGDGIGDGDEIKLGLDPLSTKTNGILDNQNTKEQSISTDSKAFAEINTKDSPFAMSLDIKAAGYVEGNISIKKSDYAKAIKNEAALGISPELKYNSNCKIDSAVIKFKIDEKYIPNEGSKYADASPEFKGIKRYNIFRYFDDTKVLLPVKTEYDTANNTIYTKVDRLGTYCVMDMEKWLTEMNITPKANSSLKSLQNNLLLSQNSPDHFSENETRGTFTNKPQEKTGIVKTTKSPNTLKMNDNNNGIFTGSKSNTPVDIVFLLETEGTSQDLYEQEKTTIVNASSKVFAKYAQAKVCIVEYKYNDADFVKNGESKWMTNCDDIKAALASTSYQYSDGYCNRGTAFSLMLNEVDFRNDSSKLVFQLINGNTDVGSGYFSELDACTKGNINYSEIFPEGWHYVYADYEAKVKAAIAKTNGLFETYYDSTATDLIYNHIDNNTAVQYNVVLSTGLRKVLLKAPLSNSPTDTDDDGLTDWQEADTQCSLIKWDSDGNIVLPTLRDYIKEKYNSLPFVDEALDHYFNTDIPIIKEIEQDLYTTRILPIITDPTNSDSDGDGLLDGAARYVNGKKVAPKDPDPLEVNGPMGIWQAQYQQEESGNIPHELGDWYHIDWSKIPSVAAGVGSLCLNFKLDDKGTAVHSQVSTWQKIGGYNDLYDAVFSAGTSNDMRKEQFFFQDNADQKYVVWTWRGNYLNLGSGAEIGIYGNPHKIYPTNLVQWDASDFTVPMTLNLYNYYDENDIDNIFCWAPNEEQWWITGFNPQFNHPDVKVMVSLGSIDFSGHEDMFNSLKNQTINKDELKDFMIFDEDGHTVWMTWWENTAA